MTPSDSGPMKSIRAVSRAVQEGTKSVAKSVATVTQVLEFFNHYLIAFSRQKLYVFFISTPFYLVLLIKVLTVFTPQSLFGKISGNSDSDSD